MRLWILITRVLQGERLSDSTEHTLKIEAPSISLFHEELDNEDFLFRTNLDGM